MSEIKFYLYPVINLLISGAEMAFCHEEKVSFRLSSWPIFITQENKMKLQITFIAMLTVCVLFFHCSFDYFQSLNIFALLHLYLMLLHSDAEAAIS
jgi:hypothetical protein